MNVLRFFGALLVTAACAGGGAAFVCQKRAAWRQVHTFCALLEYLAGGIRYQALPGALLLAGAAADPRFAALDLAACGDLGAVPVPAALEAPLAAQARQTLALLCTAPHAQACAALARLLTQCRERERALERAAGEALRLYPRLGLCMGALLVLLLL